MSLNSTQSLELGVDAYCTMAEVQSYVPAVRTLSTDSKPSRVQAVGLTRDIFGEVNGLLDVLGYVIPVASGDATAMGLLGRVNALGAASAIEAAAYSAGNEEDSDHAKFLLAQYMSIWQRLESGMMSIPGATRTANHMRRKDERTASAAFDRNGTSTEQSPVFTKTMKW